MAQEQGREEEEEKVAGVQEDICYTLIHDLLFRWGMRSRKEEQEQHWWRMEWESGGRYNVCRYPPP